MNPSSLDFALCKLMDLGGGKAAGSGTGSTGDIRLEMLKFTRQKTPDIGGENIVLIFHIRREGEEPVGGENGSSGTAGTADAPEHRTADTHVDRAVDTHADAHAETPADTHAETPVRGKILEA